MRENTAPGWGTWTDEQRREAPASPTPAATEPLAPLEEPVVPYEFRSTSRPIFVQPKEGRPAA